MAASRIASTSIIPSEFQLEVLSYLLRDQEVMSRFINLISDEEFEHPVHRVIYSLGRAYFQQFQRLAQRQILEMELTKYLNENQEAEIVPPEHFWREVNRLYAIPLGARDYMLSTIHTYVLRAQVAKVGEMALDTARQPEVDLDGLIGSINDLFGAVSGRVSARMEFLLKDAETRVRENPSLSKVPTGFRRLDGVLGGGLGKGEMGIVLAPTGYGKSFFLVALGANALAKQHSVLELSLELSKGKVLGRYESRISKIKKNALYLHVPQVIEKLLRVRRFVTPSDLLVIEYPSGTLSVDEFRSVLTQVRLGHNFDPDLVVVDYADLFKPVLAHRNEQGWESLGTIYTGLRAIAQEFNVPIWTGSQATPHALGAELVTIADVAGSFAKVRIADVVLTISRTAAERGSQRLRVYVDKNRENKGDISIAMREDFDIAWFTEEIPMAQEDSDG